MNLSRRPSSLIIVLLVVAAGCSPAPAVTPTPSPTYACIPEAGGEAVPCGPIEYEQSQRRDALYAEAEAVYRRFRVEATRVDGVADPAMTPELEAVTGGEFRQALISVFQQSQGRQRLSGEPAIVWVRRLPDLSRSGSIVAITACTDATRVRFANPDGEPTAGVVSEHRFFLARDSAGALKIVSSEHRSVASC